MKKPQFTNPTYSFTTLFESERFLIAIDAYWWVDIINKHTGKRKSLHPAESETWRKKSRWLHDNANVYIENCFYDGQRVSIADDFLADYF